MGDDHPPGLFWYHPHHHGDAAEQLFRGLYGAIIVEDEEPVSAARERLLIISDIAFDDDGDGPGGEEEPNGRAHRVRGAHRKDGLSLPHTRPRGQ